MNTKSKKTILFSPIGTADALTQLGDGPMLHIVRWYKPDEVIFFLSPKMQKYEKSERRYSRAIEDLCKFIGQPMPKITSINSEQEDVSRFDGYIAEFEEAIKTLTRQEKGAEVLVNVSSGSPAMQQALVAIGAFGEYDIKLLQVITPKRDTNGKNDRENPDNYDHETLWGCNPDNDEHREIKRIREVETPNFKDGLIRKNVAVLIQNYDYAGALRVTQQTPTIPHEVVKQLETAVRRINLDAPRNRLKASRDTDANLSKMERLRCVPPKCCQSISGLLKCL